MSLTPGQQWFQDARFGLFMHWGLYTLLGANEWAFRLHHYSVPEYARLARRFKPRRFDARVWADLAAESGMRYMVLTTRHHDGFCLFDSKVSDFSTARTAAGRDFVAEYTDACRAAGLKVGLYYSLGDWRFRGSFNMYRFPESWDAVVGQAHTQVRELLTNYGRIDLLFHDGPWGFPEKTSRELWRMDEMHAMSRQLQPDIVLSDRAETPGDYHSVENSTRAPDNDEPWESCVTMDALSWSHVPRSPYIRSAAQIACDLVEVAIHRGNLLLNSGPRPDGTPRPEEARRIRAAGAWLKRHGEALYGARRSLLHVNGMFGPAGILGRWIGTADPCVHHLAALGWSGREFVTVLVDGKVRQVTLSPGGDPVHFRQEKHGRLIMDRLPRRPPDPLVTIFRVEFEAPPKAMPLPPGMEWPDRLDSTL